MKIRVRLLMAALATLVFVGSTSHAQVSRKPFNSVAGWEIAATFRPDQEFAFCSASKMFDNGSFLMLSRTKAADWGISVFEPGWRKEDKTVFPIELFVDGRRIAKTSAKWRTNGVVSNAIVNFGQSDTEIDAIMNGVELKLTSSDRTVDFALDRSPKVAFEVVLCTQKHTVGNQASIASPSNIPEMEVAAPKPGSGTIADRAFTLPLAKRTLPKGSRILDESENLLPRFPVNWRNADGSVGGMSIVVDGQEDARAMLKSLMEDQARYCGGKLTKDTFPEEPLPVGYLTSALQTCQVGGVKVSTKYNTMQLTNAVVIFVTNTVQDVQ